jgi:membrane protein implicated in regulation of membrane protease activity
MKNSKTAPAGIALLLTALGASSITMLWLFWRFPVATAITTVFVLAALWVAARLAKPIDTESLGDLEPRA